MLSSAIVTEFSLLFFCNGIGTPVFLIAFTMLSQHLHMLACGYMVPCNLDSDHKGLLS